MGDVKRWSVTYTKHVKQKRKVYQDGLLQIQPSIRKVMLYDECETLLESRFLKTDDIFRSGETLTFDAYLVDIGDPLGDHPTIPNLHFQETDKKTNEKAGSLHRTSLKTPSFSNGRKTNSGMNKASSCNLSPSQKIIREFKRSEISKYGVSPSCPDATKTSIAEWQVLYTTQITQKVKRFHDGILKVATTGLQGRQVMLYDTTRRLLDSRFLKKDEIVRSGESLTFDGYLADIEESQGDHKPLMDLNVQGRNFDIVGKTGKLHGKQFQTQNNSPAEWEAMYTTQINQKAKKYHSGILKLASCGSFRMQVTLLAEDGTTLSRKYLEPSKRISTGSTFELPKYLVEVGEPRKYFEGEPQNNGSARKNEESNIKSSCLDNIILRRRVPVYKPLCDGVPQKIVSPCKDTDSNVRSSGSDNIKPSMRDTTNRPLRDAHAILSNLRKPPTLEDITTMKRAPVEERDASKSSGFVLSNIQGQPVHESCSKLTAVEDQGEESNKMQDGGELLRAKAAHNDLLIESIKLADSDNKGDSQSSIHPSRFPFGLEASNLGSTFEVEWSSNSRKGPVSPIVQPQILDAPTLVSDGRSVTPSLPLNGSYINVRIEKFCESMSSEGTPTLTFSQSFKDVKPVNTSQPSADNTGIDFGVTTSTDCTSHDPCDVERNNTEKHMSMMITDDCPSFDLGF